MNKIIKYILTVGIATIAALIIFSAVLMLKAFENKPTAELLASPIFIPFYIMWFGLWAGFLYWGFSMTKDSQNRSKTKEDK